MKGGMTNREWERRVQKFFILILYFLLLTFHISLSEAESAIVSETQINGLYSIEKKELLYLLGIKPGSVIDSESIRRGIKRAFLKGIFDDICIETTDGEKTNVTITVKERDFIKKIYVEGDNNLSTKFIRNNFSLKEDQEMRYDLIDFAVEKLKQGIATRGYPDAGITAKIEKTEKPYRVNIYLRVNTGEPEKIKKIILSGGTRRFKG